MIIITSNKYNCSVFVTLINVSILLKKLILKNIMINFSNQNNYSSPGLSKKQKKVSTNKLLFLKLMNNQEAED